MQFQEQKDIPDVPIRYYEDVGMFAWTQYGFIYNMCWELFNQAVGNVLLNGLTDRETACRMVLDQLSIQHECSVDYAQILRYWRGSTTPLV